MGKRKRVEAKKGQENQGQALKRRKLDKVKEQNGQEKQRGSQKKPDLESVMAEGLRYLNRGQRAGLEGQFKRDYYLKAISQFQRVFSHDSKNAKAMFHAGQACLDIFENILALGHFQRALIIYQQDTLHKHDNNIARCYIEMGDIYSSLYQRYQESKPNFAKNCLTTAEKFFRGAIKKDNKDFMVISRAGSFFMDMKSNYKYADECFSFIKRTSNPAYGEYGRGRVYWAQDQCVKALECFYNAAKIKEFYAEDALTNFQRKSVEFFCPLENFQKPVLKNNHARTHYDRGCIRLKQGKFLEALECFYKAAKIDKNYAKMALIESQTKPVDYSIGSVRGELLAAKGNMLNNRIGPERPPSIVFLPKSATTRNRPPFAELQYYNNNFTR